jgi:hypothetical protein
MSERFRFWRLATASMLALLLIACSNNGTPAPDLTKICKVSQMKNGIVHCTELFKGEKPIQLPDDPSTTQRYGAMMRGGKQFYTRAGNLPITDAAVKQLGQDASSGHAPSANTIYLATISNGTVTDLKPVADVDENAVLSATFAGRAMEGTISTLVEPGTYSFDKMLPIRVEFAARPVNGQLAAKIMNATHGVRSANGSCIASLAGKTTNPLVDIYTADVHLQRFPGMHTQFDDELILLWTESTSNMGKEYYPSIATLLGGDPLGSTWETLPHATPGTGPSVTLHFVTGGGGAC